MEEGLYIPDELSDPAIIRSIFDETKFYDQIAWFQNARGIPKLDLKFKTGGNYDFLENCLISRNLTKSQKSWMLSDHFPLWAEFEL